MSVPVGTIIIYPGKLSENTTSYDEIQKQLEKDGFLLCNGQTVPKDKYAALFRVVDYIYGKDNATGNFKLPDYRGLFMRGVDTEGQIDKDKSKRKDINGTVSSGVGSIQESDNKSHFHPCGAVHGESFESEKSGASPIKNSNGDGYATGYSGGSESRPINVYVNYMIYTGVKSE